MPGRNLKAILLSLWKKWGWGVGVGGGGVNPCSPSNSNQKHFSPKPKTFSVFKPFCWTNKSFGRKLSFFSLRQKEKTNIQQLQHSFQVIVEYWVRDQMKNSFQPSYPQNQVGWGGRAGFFLQIPTRLFWEFFLHILKFEKTKKNVFFQFPSKARLPWTILYF